MKKEPKYKRYGVQKQLYFPKQKWERLEKELKSQKKTWNSKYVMALVEKDLKLSTD